MATKKATPTTTKRTTKSKLSDLDNALAGLKKEGLEENKDFHVHEYVHGYIDLRFDGYYSRREVIEFRPDGSLIERDLYGKEVK